MGQVSTTHAVPPEAHLRTLAQAVSPDGMKAVQQSVRGETKASPVV